MNPATDVGKRDLPGGLRNRFTELYVNELSSREDLEIVVRRYVVGMRLDSFIPYASSFEPFFFNL